MKQGFDADLAILNGDPITDVRNLAKVAATIPRRPGDLPEAVSFFAMAGPVPAIYDLLAETAKTWMPGTSPGMTTRLAGSRRCEKKALALSRCRHDIHGMRRSLIYCGVVIFALSAGSAFAQFIPPGSSQFSPPPPAPPPPPRIEVPAIPKMDALPSRSYAPSPQKSFGDKVTKCLDDAAASGLGPAARTTYSRNCATR